MNNSNNYSPLIIMMIIALSSLSAHATVWRVNNQTVFTEYSGQEVFSDLMTAINAAAPGDTLMIEASATSYGDIVLAKGLTLIGPGYYFGGEGNSGLQANSNTATIRALEFALGADGSVVMGMTFSEQIVVRTGNIELRRCLVKGLSFSNTSQTIDNVLITQNFFTASMDSHSQAHPINNLMITNNYFASVFGSFRLREDFVGIIAHNVFNVNGGIQGGIRFFGNQFYNNIVVAGDIWENNNSPTNVYNNIFVGSAPDFLPTPNSNIFDYVVTNIFVTDGSTDGQYMVNPVTCPECVEDGFQGLEIGMYGGIDGTEYRLSGVPAVPSIYFLSAPSPALIGDTLRVDIHTRSNN